MERKIKMKAIKASAEDCACGRAYTTLEDPIEAYHYEHAGVLCYHCRDEIKAFVDGWMKYYFTWILEKADERFENNRYFSDEQMAWAEEYLEEKLK